MEPVVLQAGTTRSLFRMRWSSCLAMETVGRRRRRERGRICLGITLRGVWERGGGGGEMRKSKKGLFMELV